MTKENSYNIENIKEAAKEFINTLLADVIVIGEIPAMTFSETERVKYIVNRFSDSGLEKCSIDEKGNGVGIIQGISGNKNILLSAHVDTAIKEKAAPNIEIREDRLIGPFIGDNSIALAVLTSLPLFLEKLNIRLDSNIILLASTMALGRGNHEGIKYFLANSKLQYSAGITLESMPLGRLNYQTIGMLRGEITCKLPKDFNWAKYGSTGTIIPMADIVNKISRIALPKRPLSSIVLGSINGGLTYNNIVKKTTLSFEVRSESVEILKNVREQLQNITAEVSSTSGIRVILEIFAEREPGGIEITHPIVTEAKKVFGSLEIKPDFYSTISQLSALKDAGIPGITIGITTGETSTDLDEIEESISIEPISIGFAQLVAILMAIDKLK